MIFWIFCIDDHIICRENSLISSLICRHFVSSPFIALARASSSMLKRSGKRSHPFLLPSSFSPVSIISVVGFCQKFFNSRVSWYSNLLSFSFSYHEWLLSFLKCIFCTYWYDCVCVVVVFWSVDMMDYIVNSDVEPPLHNWDKFHFVMVYNSLHTLLDLVC